MPVEMTVDSLDSVDESLRGAYVETDGKFNLDPDKYAEVKAQGLKSKNKELLGKLSKASESSKRFEKFADFDDDDLAELLELHANKGQQPPPKPDANTDEKIALLEKQHKKALDKVTNDNTALQTRAADLEKKVKHFELTVPIKETALAAGVLPEDLNLALLETQSRFALTEEGKIVVLDEDGDPTDITPKKFFESLYKEMRPKFYAASGATGSGAPSTTTNQNGKKVMRAADWSKLQLSNPAQAQAFMKDVKEGKASLVD